MKTAVNGSTVFMFPSHGLKVGYLISILIYPLPLIAHVHFCLFSVFFLKIFLYSMNRQCPTVHI